MRIERTNNRRQKFPCPVILTPAAAAAAADDDDDDDHIGRNIY
jgi:hypothetical protein